MTATASMPATTAADLPPAARSTSQPSESKTCEFRDVLESVDDQPKDDARGQQDGKPAKQPAKQKRDDDDAIVVAAATTPVDVHPVSLDSASALIAAAPGAETQAETQMVARMAAQLVPPVETPQKLPIAVEMPSLPDGPTLEESDAPPPAASEAPLTFAAKVVPMRTSPQDMPMKSPAPELPTVPENAVRPIEKHAAMPLNLSQAKDQGQQHSQEQSAKDHQAPQPPPHAEFTTPFADGPKAEIAVATPKAPPSAPAPFVEHTSEPPAAVATSSNDIRVRIPDANGGSTDVRFVESGGEVKVTVRNADPELAQTLRNGVNDLSNRLSQSGLHSEIWKPAADSPSQQNGDQQPQQHDRREQGSGSGSRGQNRESASDSHRDQSGDRQDQRPHREPAWAEALAKSLHMGSK